MEPIIGYHDTVMPSPRTLTEDAILDATHALIRDEGFASLSARRLASILGVSRQVVYTHFGSMDGLLDRLHLRGAALLAADIAEVPDDRLRDRCVAYIAAARARPALFALMFSAPIPGRVPDPDTQRATQAAFAHLITAAAGWLARRRGRPAPLAALAWQDPQAVLLARTLWATLHGHAMLELAGHTSPEHTDQTCASAVDALLNGWP